MTDTTWEQLADRKAAELIEQVDLVVVTNADYEKLVALVACAYLLGRRDELKEAYDRLRGDEPAFVCNPDESGGLR